MKKRTYLTFIVVITMITILGFKSRYPKTASFDGVWQVSEFDLGDGPNISSSATIKVYRNGLFETYSIGNISSRKVTEGKFVRLNDSVFTETVLRSNNSHMNGKTYTIKYLITDNSLIMSGEFDGMLQDGTIGKQKYKETWKRVNFAE